MKKNRPSQALSPEELKRVAAEWETARQGDEMDACNWAGMYADTLLNTVQELQSVLLSLYRTDGVCPACGANPILAGDGKHNPNCPIAWGTFGTPYTEQCEHEPKFGGKLCRRCYMRVAKRRSRRNADNFISPLS